EETGTALRQECAGRPWGHRRSQRSTSHEPLDIAERRQNTILAAANCRTAKLCHESHDPSSRSTHSVSADERRACASDLRALGRRGGMVGPFEGRYARARHGLTLEKQMTAEK